MTLKNCQFPSQDKKNFVAETAVDFTFAEVQIVKHLTESGPGSFSLLSNLKSFDTNYVRNFFDSKGTPWNLLFGMTGKYFCCKYYSRVLFNA